MPSRTTPSKRGASKSRAGTRPRSGTRSKAPARKPAAKRPGTGPFTLLARGVGSLVRAISRTKELDPAHRRDGVALVLVALAVITAFGVWFQAAGPAGHWVDVGVRSAIGNGAIPLPAALLAAGIALMRSEPRPEARPRLVIGALLFCLALLGILHLAAHQPTANADRMHGGGAIGYLAGGFLAQGLTSWVALPLLVLVGLYGALVFTGTPVREIPNRLRALTHQEMPDEPAGDTETKPDLEPSGDTPVRLRKPSRRRQASAEAAELTQPELPL
ncbi:MAG TPA: DNA translocase FtsK 4TM domain-containing protein, partial [Pseudonocardiaceae bacterium]|nr:DNA translocase FtsK 4TM domain-containing protein [Pseudonocardiaceae bacterium]